MPGTPRSLTLAAKAESVGFAAEALRNGAREAGLPEARIGELELLAEEIVMNLSLYAYPQDAPGFFDISCSIPVEGMLRVEVSDQGVAFDPFMAPVPDLTLDLEHRPVGGLGLLLVKSLARNLTYRRQDGRNYLTFEIAANA